MCPVGDAEVVVVSTAIKRDNPELQVARERRLPVLSTFLGHGHISETFWYLSGSSELLNEAARRLENHWKVQP